MEDIKELAKKYTRKEFILKYGNKDNGTPCPNEYGLRSCCGKPTCYECVKEAVKDIKFKDDIEETFEAECIDDKTNGIKLRGITEGNNYQVKQSENYTNYYDFINDLGEVDACFKTRFKPLESKIQDNIPVTPSIRLKNIDLKGLTLVDELVKAEEEDKEFKQALITFLKDNNEISRKHFLEELCDCSQVKFSIAKSIGIEVEEIADYWNNIHLEKIKDRPRKEN